MTHSTCTAPGHDLNDLLDNRLALLEQRVASMQKRLIVTALFLALAIIATLCGIAYAHASGIYARHSRTSQLAVIDNHGITRASLSSHFPDAITHGDHVAKRGGDAAGLMLYDEEGIERGGYVTQMPGSNVMLILDSKYHQATLFVAGPDEDRANALQLWTMGSSVELRSDENGSRLSILKN